MKGGGLKFHIPILKNDFLKTIQNHSLTVKTCFALRDGFKKSKWKFKMAFAIRGPTPTPPPP